MQSVFEARTNITHCHIAGWERWCAASGPGYQIPCGQNALPPPARKAGILARVPPQQREWCHGRGNGIWDTPRHPSASLASLQGGREGRRRRSHNVGCNGATPSKCVTFCCNIFWKNKPAIASASRTCTSTRTPKAQAQARPGHNPPSIICLISIFVLKLQRLVVQPCQKKHTYPMRGRMAWWPCTCHTPVASPARERHKTSSRRKPPSAPLHPCAQHLATPTALEMPCGAAGTAASWRGQPALQAGALAYPSHTHQLGMRAMPSIFLR